ncbi:hypothetical protein DSECCO2_541840 [anaerobic digester metagenome]
MRRRMVRRARSTRSESVCTIMPSAAGAAQDATRVRAPQTSTTQMRQAPVGVQLGRRHRVGMKMP